MILLPPSPPYAIARDYSNIIRINSSVLALKLSTILLEIRDLRIQDNTPHSAKNTRN